VSNDEPFSAAHLASIARHLFTDSPPVQRHAQRLRPYICPFEVLLPYVPRGSSVLDIGCGSGLFLGLLAATGAQIRGIGIDTSERAIACAQLMVRRLRGQFDGDLTFLRVDHHSSWPGQEFDVVSMIDVMHHVPQAQQRGFLEQALALVKAGGVLVYKDMCMVPHWRAAANRLHDLLMAGEHIHYFPIRCVESTLIRAGFQMEVARDVVRFWYGHELRVFRAPAQGKAEASTNMGKRTQPA